MAWRGEALGVARVAIVGGAMNGTTIGGRRVAVGGGALIRAAGAVGDARAVDWLGLRVG
jgi:hypothetical protein